MLAGLPAAERSHARIMTAMARPPRGGLTGGTLARIEGRHRTGSGNALRAAVLGANDGLVSNLSLVTGVIGANLTSHDVLMTGIAGLLAGACSMGMGEWLSVNSAREYVQQQLATEADELAEFPEEEKQELALIYQAKGLPEEQAKALADQIIGSSETGARHVGARGVGYRPQRDGRLAVDSGRQLVPAFRRGRDRAGIPPVLPGRHRRRAAQARASAPLPCS